jgi:hypothetical protein
MHVWDYNSHGGARAVGLAKDQMNRLRACRVDPDGWLAVIITSVPVNSYVPGHKLAVCPAPC